MDFIDFEAGASQDSDVLVPSSQTPTSSDVVHTRKRRRLGRPPKLTDGENSSSSDNEYDLPSNNGQEQSDDFDNPRSKYDAVIHVPVYAGSQQNEYVTQVEQPWSSPTAIRGPRWQKKGGARLTESVSPARHDDGKATYSSIVTTIQPLKATNPIIVDEFDDEDTELIDALIAGDSFDGSLRTSQSQAKRTQQAARSMRQTTLFGMNTTQREVLANTQSRAHNWPKVNRDEKPTHHTIDTSAMQRWIYPLNVGTIRDYQFNIVHKALFNNILVALPTGLGKTFIAATVMLNFFNWTKDAQIVFVAPTKPLVTQQVDACFHIAGIPRSQTTLLTGEIQPAIRAEEWQDKRVFFMTPQTLVNDLKTGLADPKKIVLLVVDEAHKATGNYAYVEVVRFLRRFNSSFRVLALTATPGATVEAVQKVIDGLDIARVEIRTEESLDIRQFIHTRNEGVELFDNSEEVEMCLDLFAEAVRPVLAKVNSLNAYFSNDPKTMTLYGLMKGREQWTKSDAGRKADWGLKGMVNSCFKPLMSLAHNLELLKFHGIVPFYNKMKIFDTEAYGSGKYARQIVETESYRKLMDTLKTWARNDDFVGHPKLSYLKEVVLNHFMDAGNGLAAASDRPPSNTRIMVFAHYRDSAEEICRVLNKHQPMIRAHVFVGQSGTKGSEGMDQKTQIDMIKKFKAGTYNTLVATSIGEEGLDIGEVDLIVCYDCSKSPIRMLQRMGRTGRKRAGNIVLLLMRGKEERDYHSAKDNYLKMQAIIESGKEFAFHGDISPRIVPREIQPRVDKRNVDIPIENTQAGSPEPRRKKATKKKRPPKKFHMPDDVETGFQFLGKKKSKNKTGVSKAALPQKPEIDQLVASVPTLQDIMLSAVHEEVLEQRYAQVPGEETQYVRAIECNVFPSALRQAGKTGLVGHSSATKRLIQASTVMRDSERDWERPTASSVIWTFSSSLHQRQIRKRMDFMNSSSGKSVCKTSSPTLQATARSIDDYDLEDGFIDDGSLRQTPLSSQPMNDQARARQVSGRCSPDSVLDKPFYTSQRSTEGDESDEELPDMDQMFGKERRQKGDVSEKHARPPRSRNTVSTVKRTRRILSDESDE